MEASRTSGKLEKELPECENAEKVNNVSGLSALNIFNAIGSRFLSTTSQASAESKTRVGVSVTEKKITSKDKSKKEENAQDRHTSIPARDRKKYLGNVKQMSLATKRNDRDFRRFKAKYNTSIGNIMRDWMSLIYCILILRMNLIKFITEKLPDFDNSDIHLHRQILLESKTMYNMIRDAQHFSQEQFLCMWIELEKLIFSRMTLKNALEMLQVKETGFRDWRTAAAKLSQLQEEFEEAQNTYKAIQKSKIQAENALKENFSKLESLANFKDTEYEQLVEQITELKKKEVQMRGKILLNMKSYKDLKTKRQNLLNVESEMNKLKNDQNELIKEYSTKIQSLKTQIEEKEKQIKVEKEEKKKIKANLEGLGDFSEKRSVATLHDT